jgi:hypothetical protein
MTSLTQRLRNWFESGRQRRELDQFGEAELARLAGDAGMTAIDLRRLSRAGSDSAALLMRRLAAQNLTEIAQAHPGVLRDMERLCSECRSKGRCTRDLDRNSRDPEWQDYCPNAGTMNFLR